MAGLGALPVDVTSGGAARLLYGGLDGRRRGRRGGQQQLERVELPLDVGHGGG
jgi:hypothetical protein